MINKIICKLFGHNTKPTTKEMIYATFRMIGNDGLGTRCRRCGEETQKLYFSGKKRKLKL